MNSFEIANNSARAAIEGMTAEEKMSRLAIIVFRPQYWPLTSFHYFMYETIPRICAQSNVMPPRIEGFYTAEPIVPESNVIVVKCADEASCTRLTTIRYIPIKRAWAQASPESLGSPLEYCLQPLVSYCPTSNFVGQPMLLVLPWFTFGGGNGALFTKHIYRVVDDVDAFAVSFPACVIWEQKQKEQVRLRRQAGILCGQGRDVNENLKALWMGTLDPGFKVFKHDLGDGCTWGKFNRLLTLKDDYLKYRLVLALDNKPVNWDSGSLFRYLRDFYYAKFTRDGCPPPIICDVHCYDNSRSATVAFRDEYSVAMVLQSPYVETTLALRSAPYTPYPQQMDALMTFRLHVPGNFREVQRQVKIRAEQGIDIVTTEAAGTANEPAPPWSNGIQIFTREYFGNVASPTGVMDNTAIKVRVQNTANGVLDGVFGQGSDHQYIYERRQALYWPPGMTFKEANHTLRRGLCVLIRNIPLSWTEGILWMHIQRLQILENELELILATIIGVQIHTPIQNTAVIICADEASRNRLLGLRVLYTHTDWGLACPNTAVHKYHLLVEKGEIEKAELLKTEIDQTNDYVTLEPYVEIQPDTSVSNPPSSSTSTTLLPLPPSSRMSKTPVVPPISDWLGQTNIDAWEDEKGLIKEYESNLKDALRVSLDSEWIVRFALGRRIDLTSLKDLLSSESTSCSYLPLCMMNNEQRESKLDRAMELLRKCAKVQRVPMEVLLKCIDWRRRWPDDMTLAEINTQFAFHTKRLNRISEESEFSNAANSYIMNFELQMNKWDDIKLEVLSKIESNDLEENDYLRYPRKSERCDVFDSLIATRYLLELKERCLILIRQRPDYWTTSELKNYLQHYLLAVGSPAVKIIDIEYPTKSSAIIAMGDEADADLIASLRHISLPIKTAQNNVKHSHKPFMIVSSWVEPNPPDAYSKIRSIKNRLVDLPVIEYLTSLQGDEDYHSVAMEWMSSTVSTRECLSQDEMISKDVLHELPMMVRLETLSQSVMAPRSHNVVNTDFIEVPIREDAVKPSSTVSVSAVALQADDGFNEMLQGIPGSQSTPNHINLQNPTAQQPQQQQMVHHHHQHAGHVQQMGGTAVTANANHQWNQVQWQHWLSSPEGQMWQFQQQANALGGYGAQIVTAPPPIKPVAPTSVGPTTTASRDQVISGMVSQVTQAASNAMTLSSPQNQIPTTPPWLPEPPVPPQVDPRTLRPGMNAAKQSFFGIASVEGSMISDPVRSKPNANDVAKEQALKLAMQLEEKKRSERKRENETKSNYRSRSRSPIRNTSRESRRDSISINRVDKALSGKRHSDSRESYSRSRERRSRSPSYKGGMRSYQE